MESEQEALGFQMGDDVTRLVDLCDAKDARIAELEAELGAMEAEFDESREEAGELAQEDRNL